MTQNYQFQNYTEYDDSKDFDDYFTEEDYERREYYRNNWNESIYDRQRY